MSASASRSSSTMAWSASVVALLARVSGKVSCHAAYFGLQGEQFGNGMTPALGSGTFVLGQPKCESALHYRPTHTETVPSSGSRPSGVIPSTALGRCWLSCDRKSLEPIPDWLAMFCTCVSPNTRCS